jgi:hypothetical protein
MRRVSFLYKYMAWVTPAVIVAAILALTLIGPQTVIARGGPAGGSGGPPTVGAGPPDDTGGPPEGKGEDEGGNNLSFPVIWSDGAELALRGDDGEVFEGCCFCEDYCNPDLEQSLCPEDPDYTHGGCGKPHWYLQQDTGNEWQAQSADWSASPVFVDWVDWGDNLEAKDWSLKSVVRVEMVLYQDLGSPMTGFTMAHLWGQGPDEMWGCNALPYESEQATVYSGCARLTIQKLTDDYADLTWNSSTGEWTGDVGRTIYNSGVWEGGHGPDLRTEYSAEINVPGKVIYGYNWMVPRNNDGEGYYRITFSLEEDDGVTGLLLNTFFTDETQITPSTEGEEATEAEPGGGGVAAIDHEKNLTYIDVYIQDSPGGSGGDEGGGNGPEEPGGN